MVDRELNNTEMQYQNLPKQIQDMIEGHLNDENNNDTLHILKEEAEQFVESIRKNKN